MAKTLIVVGWTKRLASGWEELVPPVKAPSNWKDKDKIAAYLADARAGQEQKALELTIATTVDQIVMVSDVFQGRVHTPKDALDALSILSGRADIVAGLEIFDLLGILFREAAIQGKLDKQHLWAKYSAINKVPYLVQGICDAKLVLDPIETLMGSSAWENTEPGRVLKLFNLKMAYGTALERAMVAQVLMDRIPLP